MDTPKKEPTPKPSPKKVEHKTLIAALVESQKAFLPAVKSSTNPHFKSRYAGLSEVVSAVVPALNQNGIMMTQRITSTAGGVEVETFFLHVSGDELRSGPIFIPANKQDAQGYGSAIAYGRRYSLSTMCGIAPADDDGNAASASIKPQYNAPPKTIVENDDLPF